MTVSEETTVSDYGQQQLIPAEPLKTETIVVELDRIEADYFLTSQKPDGNLVESLKELGLLQPVILAPAPNGKYYVRDGRRRVRAARMLEWITIPAIIVTGDAGGSVANRIVVAANALRSENPLSDYENINAMFKNGVSETDIAIKTGLPVPTIRKRMKLGNLVEELFLAARDGQMSIGVAEAAANLTKDQQKRLVAVLEANNRITGKDVDAVKQVAAAAAAVTVAAAIPFGDFAFTGDEEPDQEDPVTDPDLAEATFGTPLPMQDRPQVQFKKLDDASTADAIAAAEAVGGSPLKVGAASPVDVAPATLYHTTLATLFTVRKYIDDNAAGDERWHPVRDMVSAVINELVTKPTLRNGVA